MSLTESEDLTSVGGLFFSFPVSGIVSLVSVITTVIMLFEIAGKNSVHGVIRDAYIVVGFVSIVLNLLVFGLVLWMVASEILSPSNQRSSKNYNHHLFDREGSPTISSIATGASLFNIAFGIPTLVFGFAPVFIGVDDSTVQTGYAMMAVTMIHSIYIVYRTMRFAVSEPVSKDLSPFRESLPAMSGNVFSPQPSGGGGTFGNVNIPDISSLFADDTNKPSTSYPAMHPAAMQGGMMQGMPYGYYPPPMMMGYPSCVPQPPCAPSATPISV